jgi:RNA polymerase sigma-70 factor (ECF subfamily)
VQDVQDGQDSDESLMVRIQQGEHAAFATLVRRHSKMFYAAAYRMCGNVQESEDIVQDAFLKLWDRPQVWDATRGVKFTTWFYRVVTNLAIDRTRRYKPQAGPAVLDFLPDRATAADEAMVKRQHEQFLEAALNTLPERQKAALNLCVYEGLSNREAAEILGVGVKALESLLMRAKAGLRDYFETHGLMGHNHHKVRRIHV